MPIFEDDREVPPSEAVEAMAQSEGTGPRTRLQAEAPGVVEPKPAGVRLPRGKTDDQERADALVEGLRKKYKRRLL
jgi:hypothetical protein